MKRHLNTIKPILSDRLLTVLVCGLILLCLAYSVFVSISLRPSDLQVAVHYTAFGETNFYRDKWYYLLSFVLFGVLVAVMHSILTVKLYLQGRREIAVAFVWLSILLMGVAWFVTWSILKVAFL